MGGPIGQQDNACGSVQIQQLEAVFRQHHGRVINAAYRVTGSLEDAEDVAQTVFMRLARQPEQLQQIAGIGSYLHRAAVNAALDIVRARHNASPVPLEEVESILASSTVAADRAHASAQVQDWLRQALARLHPRTAEIFALRYLEDYSNSEIAAMTGTSRLTVGVTLHRARRLLQKDFGKAMRKKP